MDTTQLTPKIKKIIKQYGEEFDIEIGLDWYFFKLQEEMGELFQSYLTQTNRNRKKIENLTEAKNATAEELADVLCFLLLIADELGIDPQEAIKEKWFAYLK